MRNNLLRNIVNTVLTVLATAAFYLALLYAKGGNTQVENMLHMALSSNANDSTHVISLIVFVLLEVYTALSVALVVAQFKKPTSAALIPAIQLSILIISFIMTMAVCTYKKTATLMFALSIAFTALVFATGIMFHIFDDSHMDMRREGRRRSLVMLILSLVFEMTVFLIPVLYFTNGNTVQYEILFNVFSRSRYSLLSSVLFLVYFVLFVGSLVYAINHLKYLYQDNDRFNGRLSNLIYLSAGVTFSFFLVGTIVTFYYKSKGIHADTVTLSYMPFILSSGLLLVDAIYNGRFKEIEATSTKKGLSMRTLMLFFVVLFTGLTVISLLSNLIIATFDTPNYEVLRVNGFDVLAHYRAYGESYQTLAFFLMSIIIVSVILLLFVAVSFFRNSKMFKSLFIVAITIDFLSIAALAAFGKYYEVVQKANIERLQSLFSYYGINIDAECTVTSDVLYYFLAATGLLVAMFILRPYTRFVIEENAVDTVHIDESSVIGVDSAAEGEGDSTGESTDSSAEGEATAGGTASSDTSGSAVGGEATAGATTAAPSRPAQLMIDQCPPFTFLDEKEPDFDRDVRERIASKYSLYERPTLKNIVQFVVDYAKNCRLHLSYTTRDIATFIAGLGVSRLSILQGMSGTGKTSLPKIFAEALLGNCEIVEVESSWKDKNELLGYYNEFSKVYTPKKFTQDLYKAKDKANSYIITFIVLDEMNLSRIEYYFSDFLSLMENEEDKREIKLVNVRIANYESGERVPYKHLVDDMVLKIPKNVWFIGTANRDESTFEISDKVYDRATTMNFTKRAKKITEFGEVMNQRFLDYGTFRALLDRAMSSMEFNLSDMPQIARAEELLAPYNLSFGNRIERQMENFVKVYSACLEGEDVVAEALEAIFLSKVVAKLEFKTVENKEELAESFDNIGLHKCAEFIRKLNEDI